MRIVFVFVFFSIYLFICLRYGELCQCDTPFDKLKDQSKCKRYVYVDLLVTIQCSSNSSVNCKKGKVLHQRSVGSSLLDLRKLKKRIVKLNPDWESTNQKVYTVDSLEKGTNSTMMYVFPVQKVSYYSLRKLCRSRE